MKTKRGTIDRAIDAARTVVEVIAEERKVPTAVARAEIAHKLYTDLNQKQRAEFRTALNTIARGKTQSPLVADLNR